MYQVSVESHFEAAHFLKGYKGKCENIHGHRYKVIVNIQTSKLNDIGLAYDFVELKKHLNEILGKFDHNCLNDLPPFKEENPSAENIARTIYDRLKPAFNKDPLLLNVQVWESPENCVTYFPD
jgi:6-pyruvoyltetrahydropterin/6-carboxytetrahydropterin synthase